MKSRSKRVYKRNGIYVRDISRKEATLQHLQPSGHGRYGTRKDIADDIRHYRTHGHFPVNSTFRTI